MHRGVVNDSLVALLGHELCHTVEVADAAWVTNQESYRALDESTGRAAAVPLAGFVFRHSGGR